MRVLKPEDLTLWVDERVLAINKPAGLLTIPDGYDRETPHVRSLLEPFWGRLWIVHRLDRDTSGVLILARSAQTHRQLNTQFERRQVAKTYHALVVRDPGWDTFSADQPLRPDGDRRHRTVVDTRRGVEAVTHLRVLERYGRYSLVEARPKTGRRHQIRAHLAALGHPIVGDRLYGESQGLFLSEIKADYRVGESVERALIERQGLHARELVCVHPGSKEELCLDAPYAKDFKSALRQLRKYP